ncbi:endonuclease NucS domain-containing protein [Rubritalea tangerina]|uniref:Endonuclease NucS domain-containing protein n=1 Tax=Rubritalea tangerina TaxID=430798 RepID=A0ABW4ZDH2_9BACT
MPITNTLWNVSNSPSKLQLATLDSEAQLEEMIVKQPSILSEHWLLIGQQVQTSHGGFIDLLAIDAESNLVVIELKKDKTPRDVVAQALDYASWVKNLESNDIAEIYDSSRDRLSHTAENLDTCFKDFFGSPLNEDSLNVTHQIVVVASKLDPSTERIVNYLNDLDVAINVLFFEVFQHGSERLLSRTWLADPVETTINANNAPRGDRGTWNGEFYVSFGEGDSRNWDEAQEYGFVSAGGGAWYSRTLQQLQAGDRIWVNIPQRGFVGVGTVKSPAIAASDFHLRNSLTKGHYHKEFDDSENSEYFVEVDWIKTIPLNEAYRETGFFGNQNTVCKPRTKNWNHTVKKLKQHFSVE